MTQPLISCLAWSCYSVAICRMKSSLQVEYEMLEGTNHGIDRHSENVCTVKGLELEEAKVHHQFPTSVL